MDTRVVGFRVEDAVAWELSVEVSEQLMDSRVLSEDGQAQADGYRLCHVSDVLPLCSTAKSVRPHHPTARAPAQPVLRMFGCVSGCLDV